MMTLSRWVAVSGSAAAMVLGAAVGTAGAMELTSFGGELVNADTLAPELQAGAHPDYRVKMVFPEAPGSTPGFEVPKESARTIEVTLPSGLVGNPLAAARCSSSQLTGRFNGTYANCPIDSQVGFAAVQLGPDEATVWTLPVYNLNRPADKPGEFGFNFLGAVVRFAPRVRAGDYRIVVQADDASQAKAIFGIDLTMWGVPADTVHDPQRWDPDAFFGNGDFGAQSNAPRTPFMTSPTVCSGEPLATEIRVDSWQSTGTFGTASFSKNFDGDPLVMTGCDKLGFDPQIDVTPTGRATDAPSGLEVDLRVPQNEHPDGLATAHVKDVRMELPPGMSVSPSSAAGLGACSPAQIGIGTDAAPSCPRSSKLGTVSVETPLLEEPLKGDVILATPDQNPFGSLVALYLVAEGSGVRIKLPGHVDPNPVTGQLTATFSNNPQLPFSALKVRFDGGENASLATPTTCGRYETKTQITSWSGKTVNLASPMVIDQGCEARGFSPGVSAGSSVPVAGKDSSFVMTIDRPDRQQNLSGVSVALPPGLLARIRDVDLCPEANAAAGTCGASSQTGTTHVLSGPGSLPLPVRGQVYLTGPYKGAPYGLSIVVPTAGQAGPFDLGNVVVRAQVLVDRTDAHVTVISDPLPTILRGFPLRIRQVVVDNNRPGFHFNPTSCSAKTVDVSLLSTEGARSDTKVPYRLAGCGDLEQDQKVSVSFTNKSQTKPGKHPGVRARMTSKGKGTNLRKIAVKLPLSVALDPKNAKALCKPDERIARKCPDASIVGNATAVSVLREPLKGPVYFVEGTRVTKAGKVVPTLPKLWIPLQGGGVTIDVNADSDTDKQQRLVSTFSNLPDAPISSFDLRIGGGKHGILKIPPSKDGGTCTRDKRAYMELIGQNGKRLERVTNIKVDGCKKAKKSSKRAARAKK